MKTELWHNRQPAMVGLSLRDLANALKNPGFEIDRDHLIDCIEDGALAIKMQVGALDELSHCVKDAYYEGWSAGTHKDGDWDNSTANEQAQRLNPRVRDRLN